MGVSSHKTETVARVMTMMTRMTKGRSLRNQAASEQKLGAPRTEVTRTREEPRERIKTALTSINLPFGVQANIGPLKTNEMVPSTSLSIPSISTELNVSNPSRHEQYCTEWFL